MIIWSQLIDCLFKSNKENNTKEAVAKAIVNYYISRRRQHPHHTHISISNTRKSEQMKDDEQESRHSKRMVRCERKSIQRKKRAMCSVVVVV